MESIRNKVVEKEENGQKYWAFEGLTSLEIAVAAACGLQDFLYDFSHMETFRWLDAEERTFVSRLLPLPVMRVLDEAAYVIGMEGNLPIPRREIVELYADLVSALWRNDETGEVPFLYNAEADELFSDYGEDWDEYAPPTDRYFSIPKSENRRTMDRGRRRRRALKHRERARHGHRIGGNNECSEN